MRSKQPMALMLSLFLVLTGFTPLSGAGKVSGFDPLPRFFNCYGMFFIFLYLFFPARPR